MLCRLSSKALWMLGQQKLLFQKNFNIFLAVNIATGNLAEITFILLFHTFPFCHN